MALLDGKVTLVVALRILAGLAAHRSQDSYQSEFLHIRRHFAAAQPVAHAPESGAATSDMVSSKTAAAVVMAAAAAAASEVCFVTDNLALKKHTQMTDAIAWRGGLTGGQARS